MLPPRPSGISRAMWRHLEQFKAIWSHVEPYGTTWSHLEPSETIFSNIWGPVLKNEQKCNPKKDILLPRPSGATCPSAPGSPKTCNDNWRCFLRRCSAMMDEGWCSRLFFLSVFSATSWSWWLFPSLACIVAVGACKGAWGWGSLGGELLIFSLAFLLQLGWFDSHKATVRAVPAQQARVANNYAVPRWVS